MYADGSQGLVSIIIASVAYFCIPETAKFLMEGQRIIAVDRIRIDAAGTTEHSRTRVRHVLQACTNTPILCSALGFFFGKYVSRQHFMIHYKITNSYCYNTCAQSFSLFSSSIIKAMGYTSEVAQLLSGGPYVRQTPISHSHPS
jgi:hypothetical protein